MFTRNTWIYNEKVLQFYTKYSSASIPGFNMCHIFCQCQFSRPYIRLQNFYSIFLLITTMTIYLYLPNNQIYIRIHKRIGTIPYLQYAEYPQVQEIWGKIGFEICLVALSGIMVMLQ